MNTRPHGMGFSRSMTLFLPSGRDGGRNRSRVTDINEKQGSTLGRGKTYPLNPADHVLLVTHESLQYRGYCGLNVMLIADLEGRLEPAELSEAVRELGRRYPALSAHIKFKPILNQPYWHIAEDAQLEDAVEYVYHRIDPQSDDGLTPLSHALNDRVDVRRGPQLRLVHVDFGDGRHRIGLRWEHALMDVEGAHRLLRCLHEIMSGMEPTLDPDPLAVLPPPFTPRFPKSILRVWQGQWRYVACDCLQQPRIVGKPETTSQRCLFTLRSYDAEKRKQFEELAKARTSAGPLRYSRAMIVALGRTYLRMCTEKGRPRSHYMFPLPLPLNRNGPRPGVHGNYVTIPWIIFRTADLADWTTADAVAATQFREFFEKHRDEATWMMYKQAAAWHFGLTRWFTTHRKPRAAAGFTGYQFDDSVTRLGQAVITNLAGAGPMNCHPGWMLGRTTYGDRMSLSITYFEDYFDTPNVIEFFDLLEKELFDPYGT